MRFEIKLNIQNKSFTNIYSHEILLIIETDEELKFLVDNNYGSIYRTNVQLHEPVIYSYLIHLSIPSMIRFNICMSMIKNYDIKSAILNIHNESPSISDISKAIVCSRGNYTLKITDTKDEV